MLLELLFLNIPRHFLGQAVKQLIWTSLKLQKQLDLRYYNVKLR